MRAVRLDFADPTFPASLIDVDPPPLPGPQWARLEVIRGGICGSDLHFFSPPSGGAPALVPFHVFPFLIGHEVAGRIVEAGADCPIPEGTRVAVEPTITCGARGIDPPCPPCALGDRSSCQRTDSRVVTPGPAVGFTTNLGGGWSEQVVAHRSMLFAVPDAVPDDAVSLHEPLSIAVHGLLRSPPRAGVPVLVVGAGIIGLAAVAALSALWPHNPVTVVARHDHQAAAAAAAGARAVVRPRPDLAHFEELAGILGIGLTGTGEATMLRGGFPYVVEAVGTAGSVTEALRAVDNRGTVLLLGAAGQVGADLSPIWWKEAALVGAVNHSWDRGPDGGGRRHSVERALDILAGGHLPVDLVVTHRFALADLRDAVGTALNRQAGAIKVVFAPNG